MHEIEMKQMKYTKTSVTTNFFTKKYVRRQGNVGHFLGIYNKNNLD